MEQKDILVVEDNEELRPILDTFYSLLPYTYEVVPSGEEAVKLINCTDFKVYVLDINLGYNKMHGVDLAILIRRRDKEAKIYALTGHLSLFDTIDPEVAGFNEVYYKPNDYKRLLQRIQTDLGDIECES